MGAREPYVAVRGENSEKASQMPWRRSFPQSGDVLVSRPTARADVYAIGVVPIAAKIVAMHYDAARIMILSIQRTRRDFTTVRIRFEWLRVRRSR